MCPGRLSRPSTLALYFGSTPFALAPNIARRPISGPILRLVVIENEAFVIMSAPAGAQLRFQALNIGLQSDRDRPVSFDYGHDLAPVVIDQLGSILGS